MNKIVLATLNAKYIHASFGLRYLMANLGVLAKQTTLLEFDIKQRPLDIAEKLLAQKPRIIGLGVYIWNAIETLSLVRLLKRVAPSVTLVLGGPEVSFESEAQEICALADYVIQGEADLTFPELCNGILGGTPPTDKLVRAALPDVNNLVLPYSIYSDADIAHRIIYVEASRGCPFTCEFCLSSLEIPVRQFDLDPLLVEFEKLLQRGVRHFKFVDRTFNLNVRTGTRILEFFLERYTPGLFVHFEMVPDRLPPALRDCIRRFPPRALQFEVGIQSFNPLTGELIKRRQDFDKLEDNFRFLRQETGVHVHADLIVGLPGEDVESFGQGFDRLIKLGPQEIQVGILKRLRGTPIIRHDAEWQMLYSPTPPYELLQNKLISFADMQRMGRFARYWDLVGNSGNFTLARELLWRDGSPFLGFMGFSDWLYARSGMRHGFSPQALADLIYEYVVQRGVPEATAQQALDADFKRLGRGEYTGQKDSKRQRHTIREGDNSADAFEKTKKHSLPRQARH
ncbi:MAG: B12-binding domain-containing radical SAM protein [Oligoflexia bacterium]|nr:B12-binding domain-containing radical SAM protein [Oligoflexia bacterium]